MSDLCNHFNNHFSTIGSNLSNSLNVNNVDALNFMDDANRDSIFILPRNRGELLSIMGSLPNKSSHPHQIPSFVLKSIKFEVADIICKLFNLSVLSGKFPSCLKLSRVIPIFKSGEKSLLTNYRPISILSVISKIFEKLMYNRLNCFLDRHNIPTEK